MDLTCPYPPELAQVPTVLWHSHRQEWLAYTRWCTTNGYRPFPASAFIVQAYVQHLARRYANPTRLWIWRSALDHTARHHLPGTTTALPRPAVRLIDMATTAALDTGWRPPRLPLVPPDEIRAALNTCAMATEGAARDGALLATVFMAYQTPMMITAYRLSDLGLNAAGLKLRRRTSLITLTAHPTEDAYCPVALMRRWVAELLANGHGSGALFRPINSHGKPSASSDGPDYRMSLSAVVAILDRIGNRSGIKVNALILRRLYVSWLRTAATDPASLAWMLSAASTP